MEKKELIELINMVMDAREATRVVDEYKAQRLRSDSLENFSKAFSKMQGEYESVMPNRQNPAFRSNYADLDRIFASVWPLLSKHGFSISQNEEEYRGANYLRTELMHNSGEFKCSLKKITQDKQGLQGYGTALSYNKRYSACALLGITIAKDPDDNDAEAKSDKKSNVKTSNKKSNTKPKEETKVLLSGEIDYINTLFKDKPKLLKVVLEELKVESLTKCPKKYFDTICTFIDD